MWIVEMFFQSQQKFSREFNFSFIKRESKMRGHCRTNALLGCSSGSYLMHL